MVGSRGTVNRVLLRELEELHPRQRAAVLHDGHVVVRAGPGSGKTRTLVARLAYVLDTQLSPFRGVACITYTNAAATEVRRRLAGLHVRTDQRLACSTVHSFCLNEILRAFSAITGLEPPAPGAVISDGVGVNLLQQCYDEVGIVETAAQWRQAAITRIRRAMARGESLDSFDVREVQAARRFERLMSDHRQIDFELMVSRGLEIVLESAPVRDLLRARFPEIAVDEYQDLGGVLHDLTVALADQAGIRIFAVGDVDQSLFGFTGADPRFMRELEDRGDFLPIELEINYRSGQKIIRASEAALGTLRGRRARVGAASGEVTLRRVEGGLDDHAQETCDIVENCLSEGVPPEKIAVLYPARGPVLTTLLAAMSSRRFAFLHERESVLPPGTLSRFVQLCASRAVLSSQVKASGDSGGTADLSSRSEAPDLLSLAGHLDSLRREAGLAANLSRLAVPRALQRLLDPVDGYAPEREALPWLKELVAGLDLTAIAGAHADADNGEAVDRLLQLCDAEQLALQDLASKVEVIGKVVLTTYHSAKGREFRRVILPGLVNGVIPRSINDMGTWRDPNPSEEAEQRRSFYVALTRAEEAAYLIVGPGYHTTNGYWRSSGPSRFVRDMARLMRESD